MFGEAKKSMSLGDRLKAKKAPAVIIETETEDSASDYADMSIDELADKTGVTDSKALKALIERCLEAYEG